MLLLAFLSKKNNPVLKKVETDGHLWMSTNNLPGFIHSF